MSLGCGVLPDGTGLHDFHVPPRVIHARNQENLYWQGFETQMTSVYNVDPSAADVRQDVSQSWGVTSHSALTACDNQEKFFKALDQYDSSKEGAVDTSHTNRKSDPYNERLSAAMSKCPESFRRASPTVVMEAAFYLLLQGLLDIPGVGSINVKQARAFLWNAAWLQEFMNKLWNTDEVSMAGVRVPLSRTQTAFATLCLAIVGPGGTGKTAVLKLAEELTLFFAGPDTVQQMASSNGAARLLGGNTLRAVCELPFGNTSLTSKKGRLTSGTLAALRKNWATTIGKKKT